MLYSDSGFWGELADSEASEFHGRVSQYLSQSQLCFLQKILKHDFEFFIGRISTLVGLLEDIFFEY